MDPLTLASLGFLSLFFARGMVQRSATQPENLRLHPLRERIVDMIRREPGKNITGILRELGSTWGTVQHHLYLLERAGILSSSSHGREHHYFHGQPEDADRRRLALLRRGRVPQLVQLVAQEPGRMQQELTKQLGMSRKVFREYIDLLVQAELIQEVREAKVRRYYATARLQRIVSGEEASGEGLLAVSLVTKGRESESIAPPQFR